MGYGDGRVVPTDDVFWEMNERIPAQELHETLGIFRIRYSPEDGIYTYFQVSLLLLHISIPYRAIPNETVTDIFGRLGCLLYTTRRRTSDKWKKRHLYKSPHRLFGWNQTEGCEGLMS
jgi:hypothetical protein